MRIRRGNGPALPERVLLTATPQAIVDVLHVDQGRLHRAAYRYAGPLDNTLGMLPLLGGQVLAREEGARVAVLVDGRRLGFIPGWAGDGMTAWAVAQAGPGWCAAVVGMVAWTPGRMRQPMSMTVSLPWQAVSRGWSRPGGD